MLFDELMNWKHGTRKVLLIQCIMYFSLQVEADEEALSPRSSIGAMDDLAAAVNTSSPEVLLELAEECSLGSEMFADPSLKLRVNAPTEKAKKRKSTKKKKAQISAPKRDEPIEDFSR